MGQDDEMPRSGDGDAERGRFETDAGAGDLEEEGLRIEVDDRALDLEGLSQDERRDPGRAFQAFLTFARQPATCPGGTTEGSLIWAELSVDRDESGTGPATTVVLFSRDVPALDADGGYVGRWGAGLALRFSGEAASALPEAFHLSAEIDSPWADPGGPSDEPTTVERFEQAFRAALPQFFALRADDLTVDRLQPVG